MSLLDAIEALAAQFAFQVVAAVRDANLSDVVALSESRATIATRPGGLAGVAPARKALAARRATLVDLAAKTLEVLRRSPEGVRTETLRSLVGGPKLAYQRTMLKLVAAGRVVKTGAKRGTTYQAV